MKQNGLCLSAGIFCNWCMSERGLIRSEVGCAALLEGMEVCVVLLLLLPWQQTNTEF